MPSAMDLSTGALSPPSRRGATETTSARKICIVQHRMSDEEAR
jgi:hypothetical protein